jgi:crotonobetainyl-CoA:carnitine CoA-transferase CaiB-like acyl-CoA transferase
MKTLPLFSNLTVLDLSTVLAGPSVGTFFAELGAKVIKIEHPTIPDVTRSWKLPSEKKDDISAYFASVNYGKTLRQLDLTNQTDYLRFMKLVKESDVLLLNFKFDDQKKLKVSDEQLLEVNPQLIIGKISGFGPSSDRVAYDLILQAETGFMSMNGEKDGEPVKMPVALIDVLAAHQLKEGLLIALMDRQLSSKGSVVEVSLYDAALCSLTNQATNYLMAGHVPGRMGSLHPNIAPYGEIFSTTNNVKFTIAIGSDTHFEKLLTILKIPEIKIDARFECNQNRVQHRKELANLLSKAFSSFNSTDLFNQFREVKIPYGEIKSLDQVLNDVNAKKLIRQELQNGTQTKRMTSIAFQWKKL